MGDPTEVARAIVAELPAIPKAIVKSKTKSHTLNWILALALSPFWASILLVPADAPAAFDAADKLALANRALAHVLDLLM